MDGSDADAQEILHRADVFPGQSGGPMFGWWSGDVGPRVVAVQSEMTMRSDTLTAYWDAEMKQMKQIVAEGKVNATQGLRVATGEKAVFDDKAKTITLTGNPIMRQGNNQVSGAKVVYFVEQDKATAEGDSKIRVQATIFPDELKGKDAGDAKEK